MLHFKSYPHEESKDGNTDLDPQNTYPCLASDTILCCDIAISLYLHPCHPFGCSFIQQGICFEVRGCMKPGTSFYPCSCSTDGGGYLCLNSFICGQFGCGCCPSDQMYLSKYQCGCFACELACCRSQIPNSFSFCTICFYTTCGKFSKDDSSGQSKCCLNIATIKEKENQLNI